MLAWVAPAGLRLIVSRRQSELSARFTFAVCSLLAQSDPVPDIRAPFPAFHNPPFVHFDRREIAEIRTRGQ